MRPRRGIRRLGVEPGDALVSLEPAHLPTSVTARKRLRLRNRVGPGELAAQLGQRLGVADRPRRGDAPLDPGGAQGVDLVEEPGGPHSVDARVEAGDEQLAGGGQPEDE